MKNNFYLLILTVVVALLGCTSPPTNQKTTVDSELLLASSGAIWTDSQVTIPWFQSKEPQDPDFQKLEKANFIIPAGLAAYQWVSCTLSKDGTVVKTTQDTQIRKQRITEENSYIFGDKALFLTSVECQFPPNSKKPSGTVNVTLSSKEEVVGDLVSNLIQKAVQKIGKATSTVRLRSVSLDNGVLKALVEYQ